MAHPSRRSAAASLGRLSDRSSCVGVWQSSGIHHAMRWEGGRRSTNIEDRRGLGMGTIGGGGIGMLLIVLAVSCLTGTNPLALLQMAEQVAPQQTQEVPTGAPTNDPAAEFVSVVLGDTEETWTRVFRSAGRDYQEPVLVLFDGAVQSACGNASARSEERRVGNGWWTVGGKGL